MTSDQKIRRARRWALAVIAVLAMGVFATRPNIASETQDQFWQDTGQCLSWLITDFERHQAECIGPGIPPGTYKDINGGSNGGGGGDPCPERKRLPIEIINSGIIDEPEDDCEIINNISSIVERLFVTVLPEALNT